MKGIRGKGILLLLFIVIVLSLPCPGRGQGTSLETQCDRVVDGWTLHSPDFGEIRFLGIDPLLGKERIEFGDKVRRELSSLVEGKRIRLEFDGPAEDSQGRLLVYARVEEIYINHWLLKSGYARASQSLLTLRHQELFQNLQKEAQENRRGIWGLSKIIPQENNPAPGKEKIIASKRSRYYYRPDQPEYQKVKPEHRIYFESKEEALKAGFRPYLKQK